MKLVGLSREIVLSMVAMALGVSMFIILTSYTFYFLWSVYWPEYSWPNTLIPTGPEWLWIIGTTLMGVALAVFVAVKLSRRILLPLNSVAESIRRVAHGDLNARADAGDRSLGETSSLADDFNALAGKLQSAIEEQRFWNAAIAHELRTPVTILRGRLQGLAEGIFTPDESQFCSLLTQIEGLARLIEDLRVVSLAESGKLDLQVQQADLAAEIESVVEMAGSALQAAGQRVVLKLDGSKSVNNSESVNNSAVHCDPMRIRQALLALLENIRRHATPGDIHIESSVVNGWCRLSVEDDGPGISEDFMPHVFTAFRRGDNSTANGSGLGLAVVAAIAQAHGGQARCRSSGKGGSVFELVWPQQSPAPVD
jgi:two-component system sensor histidine kinase AdeS